MQKRQRLWRIVAKALGPKTGKNEKEADLIALVRLAILFSYMLTNAFIIANTLRHWPNSEPKCLQQKGAESRHLR
jgi:hypothetical protein